MRDEYGQRVEVELPWKRYHGGCIVDEASWSKGNGGGVMEEVS